MTMIPLDSLKLNDGTQGLPRNPRLIRDERFEALCRSIRENPEYMAARPIVVNEEGAILGGNMRYRACLELGMTEVPADWVERAVGWSLEKQKRFILLDNRSFGEDDTDALFADWGIAELLAAGFSDDELASIFDMDHDKDVILKAVEIKPPPKFAWALVGVPINEWGKVAHLLETSARIAGSVVETTVNDGNKKNR